MLLRLAPEAPLPTILFSLAFPTLPNDLPFPTAWAHQVKELLKMSIDSPPNPHALDRSVWATTLLDQVNFDLVTNSITCVYVDASRVEFSISPACKQMLIRVLADVTDSATEAEKERIADAIPAPNIHPPPLNTYTHSTHSRKTSLSAFPVMPPPPTSAPPVPPSSSTPQSPPQSPQSPIGNHRRSRSLLSTLFSALIPSSSVPVPPRAQLPTKKLTASRHLRRRARSTLVDCFRAHVLPEINAHLGTPGRWGMHGYAVWACTSMLGRVEVMIQHELDQPGGPNGPPGHAKRDSAMILDYHESPFEDAEDADAKNGEVTLRQHADALRGCAHKLLMREQMIQSEEREALIMLEIRARRRAWSTKSRGGGGQRWMALGTPLRPSRLAFSWTPDSVPYDLADADVSSEHYDHQHPPPRYTAHLPNEEIEQWSERIVVDENGYHIHPPASPPSPSMHLADKSGSSASSLDFELADETLILESPDAADLDSDEDAELEDMTMDSGGDGGREMILPPELELPPGLHGPSNGRRGRTSHYLPRPPAELVDAANGRDSPYRCRTGCATDVVYEDDPSSSSSSLSKPGLSLKMHPRAFNHERTAVLLDSPTQAVPQEAVDLEAFGDVVVGTVGVPQDVGLGVMVMCPPTLMPPPSSRSFFVDEDDIDGQDIEVDTTAEVDVDADRETEPSLSPSHSSDSASVNTISTGGDDLAEVAMAQIQVRMPGSQEGGEETDICGIPPRPPKNPSRLAKGETETTATIGTSEVVAEGVFTY